MAFPKVVYNEEVMREGFGIEDRNISLDTKVAFLDQLSLTGLKQITVGAFVSPRFVPQLADFKELLPRFTPRPGVTYRAFTHNQKAREKALAYSPPLTVEPDVLTLFLDICDVHQRRNVNRSIEQIMSTWPVVIAEAKARGVTQARAAIASVWGSNFQGRFDQAYRLSFLQREIEILQDAGFEVIEIGLHDSQSFCLPGAMEDDLREIKRRWPWNTNFHLHLHNARGMAMPSLWAALQILDGNDTLLIDGTLGGIGGGQYCGNGVASAMLPTEDLMHMLDGMGIDTGVDIDRLIACVWRLEEITGHAAFGHVSKAGPRPERPEMFYDANLPAVESLSGARHFKLGPQAYAAEAYSPWREPISGPFLRKVPPQKND
jgi:hydroxymethylglutaryl-CoA lyase